MARPAPAFQRVEIAPNIVVKFRKTVLELFPEAPAFVRDLTKTKQVSVVTALEYARRVSGAVRNGHLYHPELATYATESTALRAYWKWVALHYERRVEKVFTVCSRHGHDAIRRRLAHVTVGCLARPWPGKQIAAIDPSKFMSGNSVTLRPSERWTLHVPFTRKDGTLELPVHGHEDPNNPCTACEVMELHDDELQAIAEAFYEAWGHNRDPFSLPIEAPLFGRAPITGVFRGPPPPAPLNGVLGLIQENTTFEKLLMKLKGARTGPGPQIFAERLQESDANYVVLDQEILRNADESTREAVIAQLRRWMTPATNGAATRLTEHTPQLPTT